MTNLPPKEEMERAFLERDASYDGLFYAAVTTTGIFCRPSCPARKPKTENVVYYAAAAEALFAGYRPCLRCHPLNSPSDPAWVGELLKRIDEDPKARIREADLRALGLEPAAVRRWFQARYGLSFQAYARSRRLASAFEAIKKGGSIDDVVFDHGYDSHSGFREAFSRLFGEAPGRAAAKEGADFLRIAWIDSAIGPLIAGATDRGIALLEFADRRMLEAQGRILASRIGLPIVPSSHPYLKSLEAELAEYFAGKRRSFSLPIDEPGTPFQERVWAALRTIPYGKTWSYSDLAKAIGEPEATRAVARANGMNRVAILVPCHRVIGADGGLGGYGGGLWRKARLLEIEGVGSSPTKGEGDGHGQLLL
jgi:AraC family transcriptional regulator, regulatory protein of adaptative response / methylated-DNA-[protein]-cysteine methyltransferase